MSIEFYFRNNSRGCWQRRLGCILLWVVTTCALGPMAHAGDKLSPQQIKEIRELSATVLANEGLPGLSIAVAKGDQVWSAGFGSADLELNVPVDSRSLFRTASIS